VPRPRLPKVKLPKFKLPARKEPGQKKPTGLWFRISTRFTAIGYWLREKDQTVDRHLKGVTDWLEKAGAFVAGLWTKRSREVQLRIVAVAGVLLLYSLLKFTPLPLVPCQISSVKECAPPDETVALAPANSLLYAHVTLDEDTDQFDRAQELADRLPQLGELVGQLTSALPAPSGAALDVSDDILPWAERDLALALVPGPKRTSQSVFMAGVSDRGGSDAFLEQIAPPSEPRQVDHEGSELSVWSTGFAAAHVDDNLLFGDAEAVRAAIDASAGRSDSVEDAGDDSPREKLPEARFAEVYMSQAGVRRLLAPQAGGTGASQLETFVDYGATTGFAAAAVTRDDGVELDLVSRLDPELLKRSPTFFSDLPRFEPELTDAVGTRALAYVTLGELGPTLNALLERAGKESQGLAGSLRGLAQRLEQEAGVDPLSDLLPALGGQAALVAEPTDGVPFASLIVDGVDTGRAEEAMAGLQGPLLRSLQAPGAPQIPRFEASEVDGVTVQSVQVSPAIDLSYALFDGKLVISTDPAGIAQVRADGQKLVNSETFVEATDDLPDEVSTLVFLNLDELLDQIRREDLVEDPFFANLTVNLDNVSATALAVRGSDEEINSEMFVAIPED
jgi:hypothetical protein